MRIIIFVIFILLSLACCISCQGRGQNQGPRNLILTEQELKFAGTALRAALTSNANSYVSFEQKIISNKFDKCHGIQRKRHGSRRFTGTFTIIERDACGGLDIRIDADVDLVNKNGYRRDYYKSEAEDIPKHISGSTNGGYAGRFNY